jgi:hypothetical protein
VVAGIVVIGAACGGGGGASTRRTKAITTTTAPPPVAPLTGLPDPQRVALGRSALSVKIENTPDARPQSGLDQADVVYEEVVEGGITRFWAIFNSAAPAQVGPIRSVRQMDPNVVSPLGGVVAYSGGTQPNVALIRAAPVTWVDENNANNGKGEPTCEGDPNATYCREQKRAAPHNLYGRTGPLWQRGGKPVPPSPLFHYLEPGATFPGDPVAQFKLNFQLGYDVTYQWDAVGNAWKRIQHTDPFLADNGTQIAPTNVVVMFVPYSGAGEGQLIGQGDAWVFTSGRIVRGHWAKTTATQPPVYTDAAGNPIALQPGRTWVELFPAGLAVDVTPGAATPATAATTTTTRER